GRRAIGPVVGHGDVPTSDELTEDLEFVSELLIGSSGQKHIIGRHAYSFARTPDRVERSRHVVSIRHESPPHCRSTVEGRAWSWGKPEDLLVLNKMWLEQLHAASPSRRSFKCGHALRMVRRVLEHRHPHEHVFLLPNRQARERILA